MDRMGTSMFCSGWEPGSCVEVGNQYFVSMAWSSILLSTQGVDFHHKVCFWLKFKNNIFLCGPFIFLSGSLKKRFLIFSGLEKMDTLLMARRFKTVICAGFWHVYDQKGGYLSASKQFWGSKMDLGYVVWRRFWWHCIYYDAPNALKLTLKIPIFETSV